MLPFDNILYFCDGVTRINILCSGEIFQYIVDSEIVHSISRTNDFYKVAEIPAKYRILYLKNIKKTLKTDEMLVWASENGHLETVKYLVDNGADIRADDNFAVRQASSCG